MNEVLIDSIKKNKTVEDWYRKTDQPMWISAVCECKILHVQSSNDDDSKKKLFINRPIAIKYDRVKSPWVEKLNNKKIDTSKKAEQIVLEGL